MELRIAYVLGDDTRDTGETQGRHRGDTGEIQGRHRGDTGEIQGRYGTRPR